MRPQDFKYLQRFFTNLRKVPVFVEHAVLHISLRVGDSVS